MFDLSDKHVFITGATSGIGLACAHKFAEAGAKLVLTGRRQDRLKQVAADLAKRHGVQVTPLVFDVRDPDALEAAVTAAPDAFAQVDVLVNNAGLARGLDPVHEADPADWDEMIDTNVKGLLRVTRAILPHMVSRGSGHVINLGSTAGHWVYKGGTVYCATKHAVRAITEGLRLDVHASGVRVSSIDPGIVETDFSKVRFRGDEERADRVYADTEPLTPDDVADAVVWTASRPPRVNVQEIILYPTVQSGVTTVHRPGRSG